MQVFKAYMKVLKKQLPAGLLYIAIFMVIAVMMARFSGGENAPLELYNMDICIFDDDQTEASRAFIEFAGSKYNIVELKDDRDAITDAMYYYKAQCVFRINKGFEKALASGSDDSLFTCYSIRETFNETLARQMLEEYVASVRAYTAGGEDLSQALKSTAGVLSEKTEVKYVTGEKEKDSAELLNFYFRYFPYVIMCVIIQTLCPVIIIMYRRDIRFRTECSGIRPTEFFRQIFAGSSIFVLSVWVFLLAAGMYGNTLHGKMFLTLLNSLVFTLISCSMAIFISCFVEEGNSLAFITQIISLGMSFMCGIFVPQSMLPKQVLLAARFLPAYWYVRVNDMVMGTASFNAEKVTLFILIELAFAVTFAVLTVLVHKMRYNKAV